MWRYAHSLFLAAVLSAQAPPACPTFTPDTTIRKITPADRVFRFDGGYAAVVQEMRLDTDGSPVAYHPRNQGTTHLCNGLDPIVNGQRKSVLDDPAACYDAVRKAIAANWQRAASPQFCIYGFYAPGVSDARFPKCNLWGGAAGRGEIPLQGPGDPSPGYFISTTAASTPGHSGEAQQAHYLDADRVPYTVVPGKVSLPKGGIAWGWNPQSGRSAAAVIGDTQSKFGEISIAFAQRLEKGEITPITPAALAPRAAVPWPYGRRRTGEVRPDNNPKGPVIFVYFAAPQALSSFDPAAIEAAAKTLLDRLGGAQHFQTCLRPLLDVR